MNELIAPFLEEYLKLVKLADDIFAKVQNEYPQQVRCQTGCSDCCHALFDLSLIEAMVIHYRFEELFSGEQKEALLDKANKIDRKTYKIKREAYKLAEKQGQEAAMEFVSNQRIPCPLLNEDNLCVMYQHRPITCRIYGIPTSIGGRSHTCGLSGFEPGQNYPTVKLENLHNALYKLSEAFVNHIQTQYVKMADMLIPLSMALITEFDEDYLGIKK